MKEPSFQEKQLGRNIRDIRLEKGMTLEEFCLQFDEPRPAPSIVSRWERGVSIPSPQRLKRLCEIGGLELSALYKRGVDFFTGNLENLANAYESSLPNIKHDLSQSYLYFRLGQDYLSFAEREDRDMLTEFEELLDLIHIALHTEQASDYESVQTAIVEQLGRLWKEKTK